MNNEEKKIHVRKKTSNKHKNLNLTDHVFFFLIKTSHYLTSNGKNVLSWSHPVLATVLETSFTTGRSENWNISGRHLAIHSRRLKTVHTL